MSTELVRAARSSVPPPQDPPADPRVGEVLSGKYKLLRAIGRGAMGVVYEAEHLLLERPCAIKLLHASAGDDRQQQRRLRREALRAGGVVHEHVVSVLDYERDAGGTPYLVMELLRGETLRALSRRLGPLPAPRAVDLAVQIARGLGAVHARGIVHRDLKPHNVFVTRRADGRDWVKLLDFGVARAPAPDDSLGSTAQGALVGTLRYMAPEQVGDPRAVDARADLYALGVVLYELLAGRAAFAADDMQAVVQQVLAGRPAPLAQLRPDLPGALLRCVERAMALEPAARFASARELAAALLASVERRDPSASDTADDSVPFAGGASAASARAARSAATPDRATAVRGARSWIAAAAALALVAAAAWLWTGRARGPAVAESARPAAAASTPVAASGSVGSERRATIAVPPAAYDPLASAGEGSTQPGPRSETVAGTPAGSPASVQAPRSSRSVARRERPAPSEAPAPHAPAEPTLPFERDDPYE
jgi:serine/threonine-protein kinase